MLILFKGDNMGEYKRIEWVDMLKGFGIILVMLGHASFPETLITEIYTFHMPLFFSCQVMYFLLKNIQISKIF